MVCDLADDVLDHVLAFCPLASVGACSALDRRWRRRAARDELWNLLSLARWGSAPDGLCGGATRLGFVMRAAREATATIFYAVVDALDVSGADTVAAECALAPGGYPTWWRRVRGATVARTLRAAPGAHVAIDVGDAPDAHRRARRRRARGAAPFRSVLTARRLPAPRDGAFVACLAAFPLGGAAAGPSRGVVRDFLERAAAAANPWLGAPAPVREPPRSVVLERLMRVANDAVEKAASP